MDQGLFAVSNFLLNLFLARWLDPQDYGAFAVGFTIFLLIGNLHAGLLIDPMLVFGKSKYLNCLKQYLAVLRRCHWMFSALSSSLFILAGVMTWYGDKQLLASSLWGFAIAAPAILFLWLIRRFCYVELQPELAARAGFLYLILMSVGIFCLNGTDWLAIFPALCVVGFASAGSAFWILLNLKATTELFQTEELKVSVWRDHSTYGRWATGTNVMMWIPGNIYFLVLPVFLGLEATGALRALLSIIMPIQQGFAALGTILVPLLVTIRGKPEYTRVLYSILGLLCVAALVNWSVLTFFNHDLLSWLYNGNYDSYAEMLVLLSLLPIVTSFVTVFGSSLRALERPDRAFWAYVYSSGFALSFGLVMMAVWGVIGAILAILGSYLVTGFCLWHFHSCLRLPRLRQNFNVSPAPTI